MTNYINKKAFISLFCICIFAVGCDTMGQIGDTTDFKTSRPVLEEAITTLYQQHPEYQMPQKWAQFDSLRVKASPYLSKKIFYFKSAPEEMYYVSLVDDSAMSGDSLRTGLAIRAVNRGGEWMKEDKFGYKEQKRIQERFNKEIITKLAGYTKVKYYTED